MNKRCIDILKYLLANGHVKPQFLSDKFDVSYRTIMSDLKTINNFLYDNYIPSLKKSRNKGTYLECSDIEKQQIYDLLKAFQPYDYIMSENERKTTIILHLLKSDSPLTVEVLAEKLMVSRTTIFKDLSSVEQWLSTMQLSLIRKPNIGIYIHGNEKFKRKAVMELLLQDANKDNITKLIKDHSIALGELNPDIASVLEDLFDVTKVEFFKVAVRNLENNLNITFTDLSFSTLIIHMGITIDRLRTGNITSSHYNDIEGLKKLKEYSIVENMCTRISKYFDICFPQEEVINMLLYIMCTSIQKDFHLVKSDNSVNSVEVLCNNLILQVELNLHYKFEKYEKLFNGLLLHLGPTINRVKYDMQLHDSLTMDVKNNYSNLFECVKNACKIINNFTGKKINDDEIAYLTLHFCAAIESQFEKNAHMYRVITVCSSGIGTARILESRLKSQFPNIEVVDALSYHRYLQKNLLDMDMIVSTIFIENPSIPCIQVNPLLLEDDCKKINNFLENRSSKNIYRTNTYLSLLNIIEKSCTIKKGSQLRKDIQELFNFGNNNNAVTETETSYSIKELLTKDSILLKVSCSNWKDAAKKGADVLLSKNFILPQYINALTKNCERMGPLGSYCVVSPGIAMLHAKPTDGVLRTCMSLMTLRTPVNFNHKKHDPVKIVIIFASSNGRNHLKALEQLTHLLMNGKIIDSLLKSSSTDEVLQLINNL